jgi:hypothetical protein
MKPHVLRLLASGLLVLVASCGGGSTSTDPPRQPEVARIEISPTGFLFTARGQTQQLTAKVFDKDDQLVDVPVSWSSNDPHDVSVDAAGILMATSDLGSAQIRAVAGGVTSEPILVLIGELVDGAVLYRKDQIVNGPGLQRLNSSTTTPFEVGDQYGATLSSTVQLQVGSVLVPQDDSPYAGRVISIAPSGANQEVVLEVLPLVHVFDGLSIEETFELDGSFNETYSINGPGTSALPSAMTALPDGTYLTRYLFEPSSTDSSFLEFGRLKCEAATELENPLAPSVLTVDVQMPISFDVILKKAPGQLAMQHMKLKGSWGLRASITGGLKIAQSVSGNITCTVIKDVPVPLGPAAAIITPVVPAGLQFGISGDITVTTFEASVLGEIKTTTPAALGFECLQDQPCANLSTFPEFDGSVTPKVVFPGDQNFRVNAAATAASVTGLAATNKVLSLLAEYLSVEQTKVTLLSFSAGVKQDLSLGTINDQAADPAFAANYELGLNGTIGLGSDVQKAIKLIFGGPRAMSFSFTPVQIPISKSPTGTVTAQEASFAAGDTVHFTVNLSSTTYIGIYNVDEVRIYRKKSDGTLESQPVATATATNGQTAFDLTWQAPDAGTTPGNFVAFVITDLLPFAPLEIGDAQEVCPAAVGGCPAATLTYTSRVTRRMQFGDATAREVTTVGAVFQLHKASETGSIETGGTLIFDIVGGAATYSETFEYDRSGRNEDWGTCRYEEVSEQRRYSGSGSVPVIGQARLTTTADRSYHIDRGPGTSLPIIPVNYREDTRITFVYHGSDPDCGAGIDESREFTEDEEWSLAGMHGTIPPGQPTVISGNTIDDRGETIVEINWVLTLP